MQTYQIARLTEGIGGLKDLTSVVGYDPLPGDTEFLEFTEVVGVTLSGTPIESGFPRTVWRWGMLPQASFDALYAYCTGAWSKVYIRTRVNSGTHYHFGIFKATMLRPRAKTAPGNLRTDVEVVFTHLETP